MRVSFGYLEYGKEPWVHSCADLVWSHGQIRSNAFTGDCRLGATSGDRLLLR